MKNLLFAGSGMGAAEQEKREKPPNVGTFDISCRWFYAGAAAGARHSIGPTASNFVRSEWRCLLCNSSAAHKKQVLHFVQNDKWLLGEMFLEEMFVGRSEFDESLGSAGGRPNPRTGTLAASSLKLVA